MSKKVPNVLVIGSQTGFGQIFERLEGARKYRLAYAADLGTARTFLQELPDAILLRMPVEESACDQTLAWVESMKNQTRVVVISCAEDMHYYLAAMEHGAFDYFTCHTVFDEVIRVLDNATIWPERQVA